MEILLKQDDELDPLDLEYKKILLGKDLTAADVEGVWKSRFANERPWLTEHVAAHQVMLPKVHERKVDENGIAWSSGRRKTAVARVFLRQGKGKFLINGKEHVDFFQGLDSRWDIVCPLLFTEMWGKFDVRAIVEGGGRSGQQGAVRYALSKALQNFNPELRPILKSYGLLRPDMRQVERKKYGRKKARKSPTWVKR